MTEPMTHGGTLVRELQSLRGVAACVVIVGHCISYFLSPDWFTFVKRLVNTQAAVEIFFVLSGYVLAMSLKRRGFGTAALASYYVRRVFRIYPALIVASMAALAYLLLLHYRIPGVYDSVWMSERFPHERFDALHVAASFAGMLGFLIPPVWTIFVEIVNSVLLPPMVWMSTRFPRAFWLVVMSFAALGVILGGAIYYHLDLYVFNFALGVGLALPLPRFIALCRKLPLRTLFYVAAVLLVVSRALLSPPVFGPWMNLYDTVLAAWMIFTVGRLGLEIPVLRGKLAVWIGDISFSIYLLHFPIMMTFSRAIYVFAPNLVPTIGPIASGVVLALLTAPTTIVLSGLNFRFIEIAGIKLGNLVLHRMGIDQARAGAA